MLSLTRDEAVARAALIAVDSYEIELDLSGARDEDLFDSRAVVRFRCQSPGRATFVELKPSELVSGALNGEPLDPATLSGNRLALPARHGENELVVHARMAYSNTGEGLHRFTDPEDGETYLYAQTFLDEAQRVFACFDQPDLKAPVTLTVSAPPGWAVAGNGPGEELADGRWRFTASQPLATYFVSVIAGPYHVRRDSHDGIPLAVYCRRSLAPHLDRDVEEIFAITRVAFDRYHELFGVRYPFDKFDQAFVPEFNEGAMENAGLVVLRDDYLFRSAVADDERESRALVIVHELAHMWFGDLVTMRWWDDLWLNESFAEYLAFRVVAEVTRFTNAWTGFAVGRKGWGYAADQRPSTHPVAPESIADSAMALLNFDGISYAKGASVLRQLAVWLGDEPFLAGLRAHMRTNAYGNASLDDLLSALAAASGRDLTHWAEVWLRRAQVNTLRPEIAIGADGRYTSVTVVQTAPADHPTLRPQRIGVGVYSGGTCRERVVVDLDPDASGGRTAVPQLAGVEAGDLLLLNDGDLGYAKIRFDDASRRSLPRILPALSDSLPRALIWAAAADAVRDAEMRASEFLDLFVAGVAAEAEVTVLRDVVRFATARTVDALFPQTGVVVRYLPPDRVDLAQATVATTCRAGLAASDPADSRRLVLARGYVAAAGGGDVPRLREWLADPSVADVEIDAEMRWAILVRLAALDAIDEDDIAAEQARDQSASGAEHAARCRSARPDPEAKAAAWRTIMEDESLSNRLAIATAEGFWQPGQLDLLESYVERYFAEIPAVANRRTQSMVSYIASATFPRYSVCAGTVAWAEELIASASIDPTLRRIAVDCTDELRRAVAGRALELAGSDASSG
jgi:aminopeptidase N